MMQTRAWASGHLIVTLQKLTNCKHKLIKLLFFKNLFFKLCSMKPSFKRKNLKVQYKKTNKPESWLGGWGRELLHSMQLLETHNS